MLAYRLPRVPSTPRIAVWRRLKRLGVAQIADGLVALPFDSRTLEALEWIAEEVTEAGGNATIWIGEPASRDQARALATRMAGAISDEYARVIDDALAAQGGGPEPVRRRTVARLRRELQRIRRRDYFPPVERERADAAVEQLAAAFAQEEVHA